MLSPERLAEVQKLAGIEPTKPSPVAGTKAKLARADRPKKALRLRGKIQSRGDASKRKVAARQKNPKRAMYKAASARVSSLKKKLSFQRKDEAVAARGELMERMRRLLQT